MLTGLLNRRGFDEASQAAVEQATESGASIAVMLCDIDHFKRINDTYGHETGDRALKHVAGILRDVAASDPRLIAGRQGGEEFALMAHGLTTRELARFAETIRATCSDTDFWDEDRHIPLTISIGTAIALPGDETLKQLIIRADAALYKAKGNGRNRVEASAPEALRRKLNPAPAVSHHAGGVIHHRHDARVIEPLRPDDAENADDLLVLVAEGCCHQRGAGKREKLVLRADEDAHAIALLGAGEEVDHILAAFEILEQQADALEIGGGLKVFQQVRLPAHDEPRLAAGLREAREPALDEAGGERVHLGLHGQTIALDLARSSPIVRPARR